MSRFSIPISDIVTLLNLEQSPKNKPGARSIKVHCPFCNHKGYTMDVDLVDNVYHCFNCPDDYQKNTGALDLYSRVRMGVPSSKTNRKKTFHQLCVELNLDSQPISKTAKKVEPTVDYSAIYPASDESLNAVYSALFKLPYLKLQKKHVDNLVARGLPEKVARRAMFATIPPSSDLIRMHENGKTTTDWYWSHNIDSIRSSTPALNWYNAKDIIAGVIIATDLIRCGHNLSGIPGFYHLTPKVWAFRYDQGMLIPTISYEGNIVGIQTRRDVVSKNGLRYMTLSTKGLPDGVTTNIARTHIVCSKERITENTYVILTEGPLKADIILWFLSQQKNVKDVAVIALQGVKNTRELPEIAKKLRDAGVIKIHSAFDMDKCVNLAVADASVAVRKILEKENLEVETMVWDEEYAIQRRTELLIMVKNHGIDFQCSNNPFFDLVKLSRILNQQGIEYNIKYVNGKPVKDYWSENRSKGLDDYLLYLSKKGIQHFS